VDVFVCEGEVGRCRERTNGVSQKRLHRINIIENRFHSEMMEMTSKKIAETIKINLPRLNHRKHPRQIYGEYRSAVFHVI